MKKYNFSRLIKKYGVDFQYALRIDTQDDYGEDIKGFGDKISVHEPIMPYNQGDMPANSQQTARQVLTDAGTVETSDHVWYSMLDVPNGARVYHKGKEYELIACDDYSDYSNVHIYYLKGQTNL